MSDLPKGWTESQISELATTQSGGTPSTGKREYWENGTIPWLNSGGLKDSIVKKPSKYITELGLAQSSARLFPIRTVLIALTGATTGETGLLDIDCSTNQSVTGIFPSETYVPEYLFFYLQSAKQRILENALGSAQPHINKRIVDETIVPLAPLNEQKRIVEKLEKLLGKVKACRARLDKIPTILKRFRQSVLAAACSGNLTAEWRENKKINLETDFPNKWNITDLRSLTTLVTSGSRGWADFYSDSGSIFVRAQNINSDQLVLDDVAYVKLPKNSEGRRTKIEKDDLLITITGANVTKSARVCVELDDAYVSQHVALVRLAHKPLSEYVYLWIISPQHGRKDLLNSAYGAGKPGLNLDNIRSLCIALPPLSEQTEIVRRVEDLFKFADQIEERYARARKHFDQLTNSILAKAFRGELVAQDENDEPASVLLERIRAKNETNQGKIKKKTASQGELFRL